MPLSAPRPLMPPPLLSLKYYMSARHMALAKAFPEDFTYEPHEAEAVSGPRFFWPSSRGPSLGRGVGVPS